VISITIWNIEVGMIDTTFGEIVSVSKVRPDATRVTYANGYTRTIALGGRIYI
jgi:hypothetical protein